MLDFIPGGLPLPGGQPAGNAHDKVLMVDAHYPRPDQDSGSLDQISFIRMFRHLGYTVYFLADLEFDNPPAEPVGRLEEMGVICLHAPKYKSPEQLIRKLAREGFLFFLSRVHYGGRHIAAIRKRAPDATIIFNTVDLHFVREQRGARLRGDRVALKEARKLRAAELMAIHRADATIVVSDTERALLARRAKGARVFTIPLIRDYAFTRAGDFHSRAGIAFIGGFAHAPNIDALTYFLDSIWPRLRVRLPEVKFHVIGSNLPSEMAARTDPDVEWVGYVPTLDPWLDRLRLTIAPLRFGAGAKGKVVSSLAHGVPCVASPVATEGMGLQTGQDISVANDPDEFIESIVTLYNDASAWTTMSDNGLAAISRTHSLEHGFTLLREALASAGARLPPTNAVRQGHGGPED